MTWMMLGDRPVPEREARISVLDHGLLYGLGAFETLRLYDGHPFLLDDHLDRLNRGLACMGIRIPQSREAWIRQIRHVSRLNGWKDATVRLAVTAGEEGPGLGAGRYGRPNTFLFIRPLPPDPPWEQRGKSLRQVRTPRQAPGGAERFKTANYLNSVLARQELSAFPDEEGLMLTKDGMLAEGIISHLFFVKDGVLCTPSLELGILEGVTRTFVLELARRAGIPVEEGIWPPGVLDEADEIFLTNSVREIVPVRSWNGRRWERHPVGRLLWEEYRRHIGWRWSVWQETGGEGQ
ncbi:aminotransferase class IV [Staphylospora marina]|uniref:aminotransferase class IV n=1 Tax=Staphylospora marina TaxID=2490858 RepID=UPI001F150E0F|nr:aminotransferase class IV [Staphylospora marina]